MPTVWMVFSMRPSLSVCCSSSLFDPPLASVIHQYPCVNIRHGIETCWTIVLTSKLVSLINSRIRYTYKYSCMLDAWYRSRKVLWTCFEGHLRGMKFWENERCLIWSCFVVTRATIQCVPRHGLQGLWQGLRGPWILAEVYEVLGRCPECLAGVTRPKNLNRGLWDPNFSVLKMWITMVFDERGK